MICMTSWLFRSYCWSPMVSKISCHSGGIFSRLKLPAESIEMDLDFSTAIISDSLWMGACSLCRNLFFIFPRKDVFFFYYICCRIFSFCRSRNYWLAGATDLILLAMILASVGFLNKKPIIPSLRQSNT